MAVFVMNFSMKRFIEAKEKDKVILKAWATSATIPDKNYDVTIKNTTEISVAPKNNYAMPFYTGKRSNSGSLNPYRWLIR
jgi:hypothetical protein